MRKNYIIVAVLSVIMLSMVIYGLVETGSPWDTRGRKFDQTRVSDLTNIKYAVQAYYTNHGFLPTSLSSLKSDQTYSYYKWTDPETNQYYEYSATGTTSFQLCTTFSQKSPDLNSSSGGSNSGIAPAPMMMPAIGQDNITTHPKGHYCYDLAATTYTYPQTYANPTPAPSAKLTGTPLESCDLNSKEASPGAKLKIMGIYETKNSVIFTTNSLANGNFDYWTSDPKLASSAYQYATNTFDSSTTAAGSFNKVMGYRVHAFNAFGEKVVSADYIFQGNRTIIADPRCL